jgi:hypothetical protein
VLESRLMSDAVEARRASRRNWTIRVFRGSDSAELEKADDEFWLAVPIDERAQVVWELSEEAFALAEPDTRERRLPRSAFSVVRR